MKGNQSQNTALCCTAWHLSLCGCRITAVNHVCFKVEAWMDADIHETAVGESF